MLYINTKQATKTLREELKPAAEKIPKAVSMAINDTMRRTQAAAKREVKARYNVYSAIIQSEKVYKVRFSSPNHHHSDLKISTQQLPITAFKGVRQDAKETAVDKEGNKSVFSRLKNRGKKTGGVNVQILKGQKTHIRSAFIAVMKSGHVGVFARGEYGKPFAFRKKRIKKSGNDNPIQELNTLNLSHTFLNAYIKPKIEKKAAETYDQRVRHHLRRVLKFPDTTPSK